LGIRREDARFVLPNSVETEIVVTANLREWRHIIELRGTRPPGNKEMAIEVLRALKEHAPTVFEDFEIDEENRAVRKR